jgi:hypothetical protein
MPTRYPKDLARHVHSQLTARKIQSPPIAALVTLFEVLYFASLKSEEAERISCRIAFVDRSNPDPNPPRRIVNDRWQHFSLGEDVSFTARNLAKFSNAVDPWVSTLAVDTNSQGELRISGLIDQSVHYSTYVVKETDIGPETWMKHDLSLQGFGVEITSEKEPEAVFRGLNSAGTKIRQIDMNHFGTRHRSMMRYCAANPDSIGFVISQDGDVRTITNVDDKVFLWDDVRLQSILNAKVFKTAP